MDPKDEIEIKLLLNYPFISKRVEDDLIIYKGIIEVNDEDYQLTIKQRSQKNFILEAGENLNFIDAEFSNSIQTTATDIVMVLDMLKSHISLKIPTNKLTNHSDTYRQVLYEYVEFTKFYLNLKTSYLAYDLSKINITMFDESNREHSVEIKVNYDDRNIFEVVEYDLPCEMEKFQKSSNLKVVYNQFVENVERLQLFFNLMEDFDKNCNILDPVPPKKRYNFRRIWLGETLSVIITVDPFSLGRMPTIIFLGPERMVETYRMTMNNNLENWDTNNCIFSEILKLIGLDKFPTKPITEGKQDDLLLEAGDCSICFSYRLNDKLPEIVCRNQFCDNCYHIECLYEWLMSVNARRFFTEVVGNCPNCEKNISCPIPN
ncbi:E3 ubiquitin-protein ligase FANCL [Diabrotica undecimpunctata]|uniref:E3 ubiquitin-protein ligase FANCL n=1 Tax=Diabrotica undecimpunctata TaxID=50387 RepID=UPI003B637946